MEFPSNNELSFIKQCTLLPFVLRVFQRDVKVIEESPVKFKEPYLQLINQAMRVIEQDYIHSKKSLRQVGIKIYEENQMDSSVEWKYIYKGYHHTFGYSSDAIRTQVKKLVEFYLGVART